MGTEKERRVHRLLAPDARDVSGMESWLTDMSAKGLHFREKGEVFVWFTKGPPRAVRYRLDVISSLSPVPDRERRAQAEELGWHYVEELGIFSVYRCDDSDAPELHTDPVVQSYTMDELAKKLRREMIRITLSTLLLIGLFYLCFFYNRTPILSLVKNSNYPVVLTVLALDFILLPTSLLQTVHLLALRRQLRRGLPMEHRVNYRRKALFNKITLALFCLLLIFYAYSELRGAVSSPLRSVSAERPAPLSFSLADLEEGSVPRTGYVVASGWSPLAPTQYRIAEYRTIQGRTGPDGEDYRPHLIMDYFKLALPALAAPLISDLQQEGDPVWQEQSYPGLDRLLVSEDGSRLLLQQGDNILRVEYSGIETLTDALPRLIDALAAVPSIGRAYYHG